MNHQKFDFEKLIPGFEFLKNFGQPEGTSGLGSASSWVAPTLDPKELDRKIQELKAVQFWLDQNAKGLSATIQALEVQKMTVSTLMGMNLSLNDLAQSLKSQSNFWGATASPTTQASSDGKAQPAETQKSTKNTYSFTKPNAEHQAKPGAVKESKSAQHKAAKRMDNPSAPAIDPSIWWNSLGEQFQQIATKTLQEMQKHSKLNANELSKHRRKVDKKNDDREGVEPRDKDQQKQGDQSKATRKVNSKPKQKANLNSKPQTPATSQARGSIKKNTPAA